MSFPQAFPFFHTQDPALQSAYSYGDPRGGFYPEPPSPQIPSHPPEPAIQMIGFSDPEPSSEADSDASDSQHLFQSNLVDNDIPAIDPDYTMSDEEIDIEDLNESASSASYDEFTPARRGARRGRGSSRGRPASRGRGRGRGRSRGRPSTRGRGQKRKRVEFVDEDGNPRKRKKKSRTAKEVPSTPEFKRLNGLITTAWMESDYETALRHALEAIQIHPEVFQLHGTIAEILVKTGRPQDAIGALFAGVHSSRDPENWWYVIDRINDLGDGNEEVRAKLGYCYKALANLSPDDYQARIGKLKFYRDSGLYGRAKNECQMLLSIQPTDLIVLQQLAELCLMLEVPGEALHPFEEFLGECLENEEPGCTHLTWDLVATYLELLVQVGRYEEALGQLRSLARWLLGRGEEDFWDSLEDDREWDDFDEPRRIRVAEYTPDVYDLESYGAGLPLEFRIKLGCLRVQMGENNLEEALRHFEVLYSNEDVLEHVDLFREAADTLRDAGHHPEALRLYESLMDTIERLDSRFYFDIAICYQALGRPDDVRAAIQRIRQVDKDADVHVGLAKLYQSQGKLDLMWRLVWELKKMNKHDLVKKAGLPLTKPPSLTTRVYAPLPVQSFPGRPRKVPSQGALPKRLAQQAKEEEVQNVVVRAIFDDMLSLQGALDSGDVHAAAEWRSLAHQLFEEFQSQRAFFPRDKSKAFKGAGGHFARLPENDEILDAEHVDFLLPEEYRNIKFDDWVDLLMRYAILAADDGDHEQCWAVIKVATDANVVFSNPQRLKIVRTTALRCAITTGDEQKVTEETRWHVKMSPFSTDALRLVSAANRATRGVTEFYRCGPEQKYYLRMVKAMDFAILDEKQRDIFNFSDGSRLKWSADGKGSGNPHGLKALDPTLLTLYAHQMVVSDSSTAALNWYFRAHVLRPDDPVVMFCIGLSYMSHAFKRQSHNRQYHLQQGLTFITRYCELRRKKGIAIHMQEAEYNMGMTWHSLGLVHLALPAYERCIQLSGQVQKDGKKRRGQDGEVEDFAADAAYAMQSILAVGGDLQGARNVSKKWLVI